MGSGRHDPTIDGSLEWRRCPQDEDETYENHPYSRHSPGVRPLPFYPPDRWLPIMHSPQLPLTRAHLDLRRRGGRAALITVATRRTRIALSDTDYPLRRRSPHRKDRLGCIVPRSRTPWHWTNRP